MLFFLFNAFQIGTGGEKDEQDILPPRNSLMTNSAVVSREDDVSNISQLIGPKRRKATGLHIQRLDGSSFVQGSKVPQILDQPMELEGVGKESQNTNTFKKLTSLCARGSSPQGGMSFSATFSR